MRTRSILAAATAGAVVAALSAGPAQAAPAPIIQGLATPLSISIDHGKIFVTQSFAGKLSRFDISGSGGTTLYQGKRGFGVGAVEAAGPGTLFAVSGRDKEGKKFTKLKHLAVDGTVTTRADMREFERRFNPDGHVTYGLRTISDRCAAKVPEEVGDAYKGIVDSNPYATTVLRDGTAVVADAAGNDIITVSPSGFRTEIATLPAQPLKVTKAGAAAFGLPACTLGHNYWFEPVPTDVELYNGKLYVSILPGGPEDPSLGARGKVYTIDLDTREITRIGKGFAGATDLAVSPKGKVYVTELFGNAVSTIKNGVRKKVFSVPAPSAIEWQRGRLFVSQDTFENGSIVKLTP